MSRIGKQPVAVPSGVKVNIDPASRTINIEGAKGKLSFSWQPQVLVTWDESEKQIVCTISEQDMLSRQARAYWGTTRAMIRNMIEGVTAGYMKKLEVVGVGWNAQAMGKTLKLNVGFANNIELSPPMGVEFKVEGPTITITGPNKQAVGQFAAQIRSKRKPEPYNGKGVKYSGEVIQRKQGKVFGT